MLREKLEWHVDCRTLLKLDLYLSPLLFHCYSWKISTVRTLLFNFFIFTVFFSSVYSASANFTSIFVLHKAMRTGHFAPYFTAPAVVTIKLPIKSIVTTVTIKLLIQRCVFVCERNGHSLNFSTKSKKTKKQ